MDTPEIGVDISTTQFSPGFPELETFPGDMGVIATLLSPDGIQLTVILPGGETRTVAVSGQDLVLNYTHLSTGEPTPWLLGDELAETDGETVVTPGDPPLVGTIDDFRRSLGTLVAALFRAIESAGLDPVHATQKYVKPHDGLDVDEVYERVTGTGPK